MPPTGDAAGALEGGSQQAGNCRDGFSKRTALGDSGGFEIAVPRDRQSRFEPLLVPKWQKGLPGFDSEIIAMDARGMSVRETQTLLEEQCRIEVSPDFISGVTDAVHAEVSEWQNRPLEKMDRLVFFDALRVRLRDEGTVRNKAQYLALGIAADGTREVSGLRIEQNEGAKKTRGQLTRIFHTIFPQIQDHRRCPSEKICGRPESVGNTLSSSTSGW